MARLVSGFLPSVLLRRLRRTFPLRLSVLTLVTVTSKIDSTACLISGFDAEGVDLEDVNILL